VRKQLNGVVYTWVYIKVCSVECTVYTMGLKMKLFALISVLVAEVASDCLQPSFKDDATSRVEAGFKAIRKRGKLSFDYKTIEVTYSPFMMVEDPNCIEESQLNLEVKSGSGDWVAMDAAPEALGGGKYKWSIPSVPCKDHMIKFWVNGPAGQASLEFPEPIRAISEEELITSKYTPVAPAGLKVTNLADNQVEVSWDAADCATAYDISYGVDMDSMKFQTVPAHLGSQLIISEGLEPCTDYEVSIFSVVGEDGFSAEEASTRFTTPPESSSASSLEPQITRDTNRVSAVWKAYDKLSCVQTYSVSVCKETEECGAPLEVARNDALEYIKYETENLEQCSPYTLQIQPLYGEQDLVPKIVEFRTLSPSVEGISDKLMPVSAAAGDAQKITVSWSAVDCAEYYEVFQKVNSGGGDWEVVKQTTDTSVELNGVPCTEYIYGVQVTIDGVKSEIMEFPDAVMTRLDNSVAFAAPNLEITPLEDGAVLTWDHGACISSYVVKACTTHGDIICEEETITRDSSVHNVTHEVHNLSPCSPHSLSILPIIEGAEFEPDHTEFRTAPPAPMPPTEFKAAYRQQSNKVELEWSAVSCASGYKIMQTIGETETTTTAWETDDPRELFKTLESPEPCVTYSYGVATVYGDVVSDPTPMEMFSIPPREGANFAPRLTINSNSNDTINLQINPAKDNYKCQVEVYEVRYSSLKHEDLYENQFLPEQLQDGTISLTFPGASGSGLNLEGRIKYQGFSSFSHWIQSNDPSFMSPEQRAETSMLVPIIIGILVAVVVILVVVFFVVRKKKNQTKYDAEKASASANKDEETQKLNADPEV